MNSFSRFRDGALLLFCNLVWGGQFVALKVVQREMGPLFATWLPLLISTFLIMPLVVREHRRSGGASMPMGDIAGFILLGTFGQAVVLLFSTWGVRLTLASNAALVGLALPVTTAVMAYFLLGERMTVVRGISFVLAIVGVLESSGIHWGELNFASPAFLLGNSMCFLSVLGSAYYNTYGKKLLEKYSALQVVLYSYCVAVTLLLPVTLYLEPQSFQKVTHFGALVWLAVIFLAVFRNVLALVVFLYVLKRLDATVAGVTNYLIPFFGVLTAGIFLHEKLTKFMILGGLLVLASTLFMTLYEGRERRRGQPPVTAAPGGASNN